MLTGSDGQCQKNVTVYATSLHKKISFIESQPNPRKNLYPTELAKKAVISRPTLTQPMVGRNASPTRGGDGAAALLTVST